MKHIIFYLTILICFTIADSDIDLDGSNSDKKWVTVKGAPIGAYSGRAVRNIGDFNGDGIDDMIINASNVGPPESLYVIYGQRDGFSQDSISVSSTFSEGFTIHGPSISDFTNFGFSISKAIDLNGDGLSDIVIGAYYFSTYQGAVYVIYGEKGHTGDITINPDYTFSSSDGFAIFGPQSSKLGYSVSSAGDFNGDGFDDLLVGAPGSESVYMIYGKNGMYTSNIYLDTDSVGFVISCPAGSYCQVGSAVSGVGDINGDGVDDILVGAAASYAVYGLYGKKNRVETTLTVDSSLDTSKGFIISSSNAAGGFGGILSSAGDFNHDGIQDIILGTLTKGALVFYGRKENWSSFDIDTSNQGFRIKDSRIGAVTKFGLSVSGGGDVNGDGIDDILVRGDYIAVIFGSQTTRSGNFDVSTGLTDDKGFLVSGSALIWKLNYAYVVNSVAIGDFNNDNIADMVVGAPNSEIFAGKAYIIFGIMVCPENCATCESPSKCLTCSEGYGFYQSVCRECPAATYLSEGVCQECLDDCIQCESGSQCQVCADGYSLSDSKICISKGKEAQAAISTGLFDGASAISNSLALGSSVPTNFGLVAKILRNTKYLDISVSVELQKTFNSWKITTGIIPAPDSESSDAGTLPFMFERYGMDKAFLVNYWKSFSMILIGIGCFIISKSAELSVLKTSKIPRTVNIMASNFVLAQFYGSIDDIFFYLVLDARSGKCTSSGFRTFGFIFAWLLLLVGFGVTGLHGVILYRYQRIKKQGGENQQTNFLVQFLKKYENIKLFFKDFKDIHVFQQAFLLINIGRSLLSSFIFTILFRYPILQILFLIALNIFILVYLFVKKPFKDKANSYAQYFCEGILFLAYFCILILGIMDKSEDSGSVKFFSMVVIVANMALLLGTAIFMLINIGQILYEVYKERRRHQGPASASLPKVRSRLDSHEKADSKLSDVTASAENLVEPKLIDNSKDLNTSEFNLVPNNFNTLSNLAHEKSDSKIIEMTAENFLKPKETELGDYSNNLNTSEFNLIPNDSFQENTSSPKLGHRRKIRRDTIPRFTQSPIFKPSMKEETPNEDPSIIDTPDDFKFERGDSSFSQNNFWLDLEGAQEGPTPDQKDTIVPKTAHFEVKTRSRGNSVPMRPLQGMATRERGLSVVMEGEEIQLDSKKTAMKKNQKVRILDI